MFHTTLNLNSPRASRAEVPVMLETTPKAKPCNPSKIRKGKAFQVTRPRISQQVGVSQGLLGVKTLEVFSGETFSPMELLVGQMCFCCWGGRGSDFFMLFREAWNFFLAKKKICKKTRWWNLF